MTEQAELIVDLEKLRAEYEAWFIGKFGYPPMPLHSRVLDFCWHGYQAGAANCDAEIAELSERVNRLTLIRDQVRERVVELRDRFAEWELAATEERQ